MTYDWWKCPSCGHVFSAYRPPDVTAISCHRGTCRLPAYRVTRITDSNSDANRAPSAHGVSPTNDSAPLNPAAYSKE